MALDFSKFGTPVQPEKSVPDFSSFGTPVEKPAAAPDDQGIAAIQPRPSTPAGFMLRPEFVEQVRSEYGNLPAEQRRTALQEASMGRGVRADAAKRILADLAVEDQRRREMTQGREGLMGILAAAQQQPAPRQPAAPAGPAPRVQFPDVSPTIGDIMDMVPEQERIQRRLAQDEAARTLEAAESSIEATRAREQERMGGGEQLIESLKIGGEQAKSGALGLTAVAQQAQMAKVGDQLKELEAQGQGNTPQADRLRRVLEHYSKRQQVYLGDLAQTQAKLSTAPVYKGVRKLTEAETFTDAAKAFARNPVSIVANLTAQSLPSMLPALVLGVINPALGVAAMGGSSYGVEFGNELLGFAREKGFDTTDPQQMAQFMQNPELLREGVNRAGTKAGIVAAGDMLLTGLASKTLVPKRITGPVAKNVTNVGAQMGVQGVGGAGTEALAQYVTTGEIKPGEVVAEAVGELGGAPAEVLSQTAQARREARAAQQAAAAAEPPVPPPAAPPAPAERIEPTFEETPPVTPKVPPAAQTMREQQDAIEKMEREALRLEPGESIQEVAKEALQVEPTPAQTEIPKQAVVEVPVGQLALSEDVPQFKAGADKAGIVEPLGGKFERTGVAPIQVWRRTDGRMEIISGRHRFDLAKRSGEKTIPAQIHDESKGFTRDMAAVLDAELNIRDGQGKVKDYVNYFKGTGLDRQTADARGLLARAPGKRAYAIAIDGSDELIAAIRADQISDEAAYLIGINAPKDARLQSVGIKAVADGKSAATAVNMMQAVRALAGEADTTTDMFGFDDSAIKEAEEMAKIAGRKQREIQTRLSAISGAARNPQLAASEGIDIRDPQAVNNRINELRQMKASWDNWSTNPQLVAEVRAERGAAPPVLTTQTPEELRAKAEREERARKEEEAKPAEVPPAEEFVLTGSERAADEAAARGQMELTEEEKKDQEGGLFPNIEQVNYDFGSQEPVAGEQSTRSPSLKRKVKTLNRQREDGRITPEEFIEEVDAAVKADEESKYDKAGAARVRGADHIRERLLAAKRRGELSEESVNLAEWFIKQNEGLLDDLGISIKTPKKAGTAGLYDAFQRIMFLMKDAANDSTIVHEILHHLERMMPAEVQQAIRKAWLRSLMAAQKKAKTPEEKFFFEALMNHHFGSGTIGDLKGAAAFTLRLSKMGVDTNLYDRSYRVAIEMLRHGLVKMDNYQFVNPSEFWAVNGSEIVRGRYEAVQGGVLARLKNWLKELGERIKGMFGMRSDAPLIKALDSLSEGDGKFVSKDMLSSQEDYLQIGKNIYGRKPLAAWTMPDETKLDADLIYRLQNKQIDLKRAVDAIEEAAGGIEDRWDAYLQEELYHGRTARETANFLREEVRPLLEAMNKEGVSIADLEEYLHNRFAEERNIQIAKVNPAYPNDGTPFSGGSGIDTADAQAYLNNLTPEQRTKYERLAKMVDGITKGTREYLVDSGLEERSTIDTWEKSYPSYVPLNRGDVEYSTTVGTGTGLGYSVRGPASRRATGSRRTVVDILPNIILQRERAIVRGEKNRIAVSVYGLAVQNPNSEVWLAVNPQAKGSKKKAVDELINMGLTAQDAEGLMEEPAATVVDPQTGLVTKRVNPAVRDAKNVLAARVNGQDRYVFFNTQNPRAARMVESLKNMDADQLGMAMSLVASLTRWFASINTQYNPVFGIYNFLRDFQGAAIQLSGTELADARAKVLSPVNIAGAMSGIYSTLRKERAGLQPATKQWADLWQDFQAQGGQTGYRDMFSRSQERAEALQREINRMNQGVVRRGGNAIFGWLADYNETLENAVRLSAYKAGLDAGMSKERAASLAKNLTVNFNRKGQVATTAGAWYAFFNSAVQGTTRLLQTVAKMERPGDITSLRLTKAGKVVIYGGLLIGTAQAIALAAMGYDENEPPDFVKDRNLIIPIGDGKYLAWPLPLGYHVIPAISRILTEWMIAGGKDPAKRIVHLADVILDAFNPIGNAGWSAQSIAPTVFDPIVALFENQDWTGKKIAREDISKLDPTPGYTRAKENASWISRQLSYYLNLASGGDKDKPGVFSPTPDQIDYLVGQVTGGLGREILKAAKTTEATITGEELAPYNIPLAGRFYGDTKAGYAESARFYKNLEELNILENQLKGMQARKESVTAFTKENPKLRLVESARTTERNIRQLRKERKDLVEKGASREAVKAKENLITNQMKRLNDEVKKLEKTPKKPAN